VWLIGARVCLLAAPWLQVPVSVGNGWPHNALRHHWLMPISCHFRDCKALLVMSLTHVSDALTSVQTFTFTFTEIFSKVSRYIPRTRARNTYYVWVCRCSKSLLPTSFSPPITDDGKDHDDYEKTKSSATPGCSGYYYSQVVWVVNPGHVVPQITDAKTVGAHPQLQIYKPTPNLSQKYSHHSATVAFLEVRQP